MFRSEGGEVAEASVGKKVGAKLTPAIHSPHRTLLLLPTAELFSIEVINVKTKAQER